MKIVTMGSLFDGSGGFPLAASACGIVPVWASEVEPYPIAVTKSRFPQMRHLGNVSEISGAEAEPVDVITFGSPCQDMSIAGKRAGIKHEGLGDKETTRSGLFMGAVRIIKEMRKKTHGMHPAFAVWENVPGAFSSNKGEDFRLVLETLIQIVEPSAVMPPVPQGGWPYADCYCGDGWSVAYRTFDAQHWGVPQRRRRIYLVADFRGERAGKILFERPGLRGHFETGRTPREGIAADVQRGVGTDGFWPIIANTLTARADGSPQPDKENGAAIVVVSDRLGATMGNEPIAFHLLQDQISSLEKAPCITQGSNHGESMIGIVMAAGLKAGQGAQARSIGWEIEKTPTLAAEAGGNSVPSVCVAYGARGNGDGKTVGTITGDHESRITDYTTVVCIQDAVIGRGLNAGPGGCGFRTDGNAYTLDTKQPSAVCFAIQEFGGYKESQTTSALKSRDFKGNADIVISADERSSDNSLTPWDTQSRRVYSADGTFPALSAREKAGQNQQAVFTRYIVRRLTPTECARLQGFPDKWGHPDCKNDFTDEEYRFWLGVRNTHATINGKTTKEYTKGQMLTWYNKLHTDSAEYKMWGNGIAFPCALYVMQGIEAELQEARWHSEEKQNGIQEEIEKDVYGNEATSLTRKRRKTQ